MNLKNKIIVITGASDGIGKEITLRLAREGVKLALISRGIKNLNEVAKKAKEFGASEVKTYPGDISNFRILEKIQKSIISDFGASDVLINDAGTWQKLMPVEKIKNNDIDNIIDVNLKGLIYCSKLFLPTLKKRKEAAIINIISKSGLVAQEGQSVYTASKYGARGFTEVLRADLKNTNVRIAGVYQGGTNTKMFKKAGDNFSTEKFTNPADLADVVYYMLSRPKKIWLHEVCIEY